MDDLEARIRKLERDLARFAESLQLAFRYIRTDAGSSLTKSRLVLEKLLLDVYMTEMGKEPRKPLLAEMLAENQFTRKIERRILSRMESIRNMGNLGPHGESVEPCDAERVLDDLCAVLDWYLRRYVRREQATAVDAPPSPAPRRRRWVYLAISGGAVLGILALFLALRPTEPGNGKGQSDLKRPEAVASELQMVVSAGDLFTKEEESFRNVPPERRLRYEQSRSEGILKIGYRMPYLERLGRGGPVDGVQAPVLFAWNYPNLSIRLLNNSSSVVLPAEAVLQVSESRPDLSAVLLVLTDTPTNLVFVNEGWGEVVKPEVRFTISAETASAEKGGEKANVAKVALETFASTAKLPLEKYVPEKFANDDAVTVTGEIEHGRSGSRKTVRFRTRVLLKLRSGSLAPPSFQYQVRLEAGKANATYTVPLFHQGGVKPGETENFLLRIASDRTAAYRLTLILYASDRKEMGRQEMELAVFVPRS